ncbi:MAG TPA: ABC transporter permease [Candidatus Nanoarchaeia archaeon]|nr:ABC transporter permease [Candidatus Nanoarchaeia archaeon]
MRLKNIKPTKKDWSIIKELTLADFKDRYSSSFFGVFWSFLKPLFFFLILYLVFSNFREAQVENYPLFLLLGIILWGFFSESTKEGMSSILSKKSIITRINIKKEIIVFSSCLKNFMTLLLNLLVFFIFMYFFSVSIDWHIFPFMILLVILFVFSLSVSFLLSAYYTKFRDLDPIWTLLLRVGFFASPIIYSVSTIPAKYIDLYFLNPMARIITFAREFLIYNHMTDIKNIFITLGITLIVFFLGYYAFQKRKHKFIEEV